MRQTDCPKIFIFGNIVYGHMGDSFADVIGESVEFVCKKANIESDVNIAYKI